MFRRLAVSAGVLATAGAMFIGAAAPAGAATTSLTIRGHGTTAAAPAATVTPSARTTTHEVLRCYSNGLRAQTKVQEYGRSGVVQLGVTYGLQVFYGGRWHTRTTATRYSVSFPNDFRSFYYVAPVASYFYRAGDYGYYWRIASYGLFRIGHTWYHSGLVAPRPCLA